MQVLDDVDTFAVCGLENVEVIGGKTEFNDHSNMIYKGKEKVSIHRKNESLYH